MHKIILLFLFTCSYGSDVIDKNANLHIKEVQELDVKYYKAKNKLLLRHIERLKVIRSEFTKKGDFTIATKANEELLKFNKKNIDMNNIDVVENLTDTLINRRYTWDGKFIIFLKDDKFITSWKSIFKTWRVDNKSPQNTINIYDSQGTLLKQLFFSDNNNRFTHNQSKAKYQVHLKRED